MEVIECMEGALVEKGPNDIKKEDVRVQWFGSTRLMTLAENRDAVKKFKLQQKKAKFKADYKATPEQPTETPEQSVETPQTSEN